MDTQGWLSVSISLNDPPLSIQKQFGQTQELANPVHTQRRESNKIMIPTNLVWSSILITSVLIYFTFEYFSWFNSHLSSSQLVVVIFKIFQWHGCWKRGCPPIWCYFERVQEEYLLIKIYIHTVYMMQIDRNLVTFGSCQILCNHCHTETFRVSSNSTKEQICISCVQREQANLFSTNPQALELSGNQMGQKCNPYSVLPTTWTFQSWRNPSPLKEQSELNLQRFGVCSGRNPVPIDNGNWWPTTILP